MPDLHIHRTHTLGLEAARTVALRWRADAEQRLGLRCRHESGDAIDTTTLSSGIWKALLTTAAGLIVAIPALGAHAWLGARLDRLRLAMDEGIGSILDGMARQA